MKIYAYKQGSKSAKALAVALNTKVVRTEGPALKMKGVLINWGSSNITRVIHGFQQILNTPEAIKRASNKLSTFLALEGKVSIPSFTESLLEAQEWVQVGNTVVQRNKLCGHSGDGIEIVEPADGHHALTEAPLYTQYIKKEQEYRVHVFRGEAFFVQRKARKKEVPDEEVNWKVRNLKGGFIYANIDVEVSDEIKQSAIIAVEALGLDFGAVDTIVTKRGVHYVLEVNTACGLEGTTLDKYVEQFRKLEA